MRTNNSFIIEVLVSSGNISDLCLSPTLPSLASSMIFDSGLLDSLEDSALSAWFGNEAQLPCVNVYQLRRD